MECDSLLSHSKRRFLMDSSYLYVRLGPQFNEEQFREIEKTVGPGMILDAKEGRLVARERTASDGSSWYVSKEAEGLLASLRNLDAPVGGLSQRNYVVIPPDRFKKMKIIFASFLGSSSSGGSGQAAAGAAAGEAVVKEPLCKVLTPDVVQREVESSNILLSEVIAANKEEWMKKAAINRHKMHLEKVGKNHSLHGIAKALLVKEDGTVYIRHFSNQIFGKGTLKRVYAATMHNDPSRKTYAWSVLLKEATLEEVQDNAIIRAFREAIRGRSDFNQVGEFIDFEEGRGVVSGDEKEGVISIGEAYDGDVRTLRNQNAPVLHGAGIVKLADGLAFIHGKGFIHGDVKLDNILVKNGDPVWHDYDFVGNIAQGKLLLRCSIVTPEMRNMLVRSRSAREGGDASLFPKIDVYTFACTLKADLSGSGSHITSPADIWRDFRAWVTTRPETETETETEYLLYRKFRDKSQDLTSDEVARIQQFTQSFERYIATKDNTEHLSRQPKPGIPHYEYECLLWEGMNPNPAARPDSAQFAARLKVLLVEGKLP